MKQKTQTHPSGSSINNQTQKYLYLHAQFVLLKHLLINYLQGLPTHQTLKNNRSYNKNFTVQQHNVCRSL